MAVTLAVCASPGFAAEGLLLPPAPTGPGGEDSITTSDGVRCSNSINSSGGYLDVGVAGGDINNNYYYGGSGSPQQQGTVGYARVIVPLGQAPRRLDCSRLYELEIERLRAEIQMLQIGLE